MDHLSDEQIEGILRGEPVGDSHLEQCVECRRRVAERRAIASRLRSAFGSVKAGPDLAGRLRRAIAEAAGPGRCRRSSWLGRHGRQLWPVLAAAAAVLVVLVPLSLYLAAPSAAEAAQAELVRIHEQNVSGRHEFFAGAEPAKLAEYFKARLGFNPRLPELGHGMALRGCCVRHFRGKVVGSYVVDTPQGVISVVVVSDRPETLGMSGGKFEKGPYTYWKSSFAKCDMVSVRIGDYTYCAVAEVPHEYLTELLSRLLP